MALDKSVGTQSLAMDGKKEEYKGKKLRVAIIGCGGICQTHMAAYQSIPEVEIVAGVEQDLVGVIAQVGRKLDPADDPIVLFVVFKLRKSSFGIRSQIGDADFRQEAR